MATAKAARRNRVVWIGAVLVALLALWLAFGSAAMGYAHAGTAYGARVACACRFVAGRSLDDCAKDMVGGMELVTLSDDAEAKSVTARVLLLASDTATWRDGYGCVLDRWED